MKYISHSLQTDANIIKNEISNSKSDWWVPHSPRHQIFEQGLMKFLNRNINCCHFPNMIACTVEGYEWNPEFPNTLKFCESIRSTSDAGGPFGRMCVWNIPPHKKLLPHLDSYDYHRSIVRNILIISSNFDNQLKISINCQDIKFDAGTLFQFYPAEEVHAFENNSDDNFYFLGFDIWYKDKLDAGLKSIDYEATVNNPNRLARYGGDYTDCKFVSRH